MAIRVRYVAPPVLDAQGNPVRLADGSLRRKVGRPPRAFTHPTLPVFIPNPGQMRANTLLAGPYRHILLKGGSRSGKTFILVRAVIMRAAKAAYSRHVIFRLRFNAVKESIWLDTLPNVLKICFPTLKVTWKTNDHYIVLPNGSEVWIGGLDDKERVEKILGKEFCTVYFNECSQIPYSSVAMALTRLSQKCEGLRNRAYYDLNPTTTGHWTNRIFFQKKKVESQERIPDAELYASMTLNPEENAANIDPAMLAEYRNMPTKMRQRFYLGEYATEIPGQLWNLDMLESCRVSSNDLPNMRRIVVSVDPSGARGAMDLKADEIGITVCGMGTDNKGYLLEDLTGLYSPEQWSKIACQAYRKWGADRLLAERNFGGDMVRAVIHGHDRTISYKEVIASRGKVVRAEPVAALYERGMIRHVGDFPTLEEQLTNFMTMGYVGEGSPNNADSMVWGMSELFNLRANLAGLFPMISVTKGGGGDSVRTGGSSFHMDSNVGSRWGGDHS